MSPAHQVASRRICQAAISVGAGVTLVGLLAHLGDGSWNDAAFQSLCLVVHAGVWFGLVHARALLDAKIQKARADAAIAEMACTLMRRAEASGRDLDLSIPVGREH